MGRLSSWIATCLALTALVAAAWGLRAQGGESPTLAAARARWERLTPAEKEEMRERYEKYRSLSEEERRAMAERGRALREERERMWARLSAADRERIAQLPPEQRRQVQREMFESEAREKGARIREKMPQAWLDRLDQAPPEERARLLNEFQHKARTRVALMAIDKLGERLQLPADEVARLKGLPEVERSSAILELRKRISTREAAEFGLPEGITQAQWDEWQKLPPEAFFEVMQRYRLEQAWRKEHRGPVRDERPTREPDTRDARVAMSLADALRPRPDEFVRWANLPKEERRKLLVTAARERAFGVLLAEGLVTPQRVVEMRAMSERQLFEALGEIAPVRHFFRGGRDGEDGRWKREGDEGRGWRDGDEGRGWRDGDENRGKRGGRGAGEHAPGECPPGDPRSGAPALPPPDGSRPPRVDAPGSHPRR